MATIKNYLAKRFGVLTTVKILENRILNILGVQVFRLIMAKYSCKLRRFRLGMKANSPEQKQFLIEGVLIKPDFLPSSDYQKLKKEVLAIIEDKRIKPMIREYGPVTKYTYNIYQLPIEKREKMTQFFSNKFLKDIFTFSELKLFNASNYTDVRYIEVVVQNEPIPGKFDYETELHSDTFFDTHKSWLYLTEVSLEDAPLVVVPKTHKLNWSRIKNEYLNSIKRKPEVSRRISENELAGSGQKELPIICEENTLVVANTFAYHRRHSGLPGRKRIALHVSERSNPFRL